MARRTVLVVVGLVALVVGGVWVGQGLNLIPGSFMTGNRMWSWIGLALVLSGLAVLLAGLRRGPRRRG
jgi:hypothetical protein